MSRRNAARSGRHHHQAWRRLLAGLGRPLVLVLVVVAVATAGEAGAAPPASPVGAVAGPSCEGSARHRVGERPDTLAPHARLAGAHRAGATSLRPLKATPCGAPELPIARGWVATGATTPGAPPAGAARAPSSRGPPA